MSSPRIVVDYDLLGNSATSLRSIGDEFENTARIKGDLSVHLGSEKIAEAMGEFADEGTQHPGGFKQPGGYLERQTRASPGPVCR